MIIEGHFAGTRAQYYTDRDIEQLRKVYSKSYPFIEVGPVMTSGRVERTDWHDRVAQIESQVARQKILEAKLRILEDQMGEMKQSLRQKEQSG